MFLKHIGRQGDRKVAIIFREVPGEDHMALVVYPDVLPTHMHDALMKAIESAEAQSADSLGDALHSKLFPDGRPMLVALHTEGMIKKVQTETVVVTPTPSTSARLDEINKIVREMKTGEEAVRRLAEIDASAGITGNAKRRDDFGRELPPTTVKPSMGLDDTALASNLRQQAAKMEAEAKGLLAESARLQQEANSLVGVAPAVQPAKKRGRPSKQAQVADASNS